MQSFCAQFQTTVPHLCTFTINGDIMCMLTDHSGGARILEQVGPEAGPKVVW